MGDLQIEAGSDAARKQQAKDAFDRGIAFMDSDKYDQAIAALSEAIRLCSALTMAYFARAHAYAEKGDHDLAIADCGIVIGLDPEHFRAYRLRALMHDQSGNWSKGERDMAKAKQIEMRRE